MPKHSWDITLRVPQGTMLNVNHEFAVYYSVIGLILSSSLIPPQRGPGFPIKVASFVYNLTGLLFGGLSEV